MDREELLTLLRKTSQAFQMTGSRYICDPAPVGTDEDYIVLSVKKTSDDLYAAGFTLNTDSELYDGCPDFYAWRFGEFNIICVDDPDMYARWVDATEQAKGKNLLKKEDRIALFQRVLYGDIAADLPF